MVSPLWIYFQGVKSDFRTSSGMFLGHRDKKFPMVQVLITKKLLVYFDVSSNGYGCAQKLTLWKSSQFS